MWRLFNTRCKVSLLIWEKHQMLTWTKLTSNTMLQILSSNCPSLGVSLSLDALFGATLVVFGKSFKQWSGLLIDAQGLILWLLLELRVYVKVINPALGLVWILGVNLPVYAFPTTSELLGRQVQLFDDGTIKCDALIDVRVFCTSLSNFPVVLISHLPSGNRDITLIYIVFSLL